MTTVASQSVFLLLHFASEPLSLAVICLLVCYHSETRISWWTGTPGPIQNMGLEFDEFLF